MLFSNRWYPCVNYLRPSMLPFQLCFQHRSHLSSWGSTISIFDNSLYICIVLESYMYSKKIRHIVSFQHFICFQGYKELRYIHCLLPLFCHMFPGVNKLGRMNTLHVNLGKSYSPTNKYFAMFAKVGRQNWHMSYPNLLNVLYACSSS